MWFFGSNKDKNAGETQPKRRSTFGLLFNPNIGDSIRPLGETTSVFVQLIAMVFAMNGLFPKNHPALVGTTGARLSLSEVIGTAWRDLSFTKEGIPKVILFVAVTGTMILAVLSIVTALLAVFTGSAHADTVGGTGGGFFSPTSDDLAQNWLDYIFKGIPLADYYAQNGTKIPQSTGIQCSLMTALGFYSNAMLVFAGVILFYHLVTMVMHTAHEGVVMGKKANQIWAPIRLVVAIGLLVPVGAAPSACPSKTGAGLNSGQYIVIQMASWGSGLASQAWATFINTLSGMGYDYIKPSPPEVQEVGKDIVLMEACKFAWNYRVCLADTGGDSSKCTNPNSYSPKMASLKSEMIAEQTPSTLDPNTGNTTYHYTPSTSSGSGPMNGADICGTLVIPGAIPTAQGIGNTEGQIDPGTIAIDLSKAQNKTITDELPEFAKVGAEIAKLIPALNDDTIPTNDDYINAINKYQTDLKTNLDNILGDAKGGITQGDANKITALGWAAAGAWLNTIARDQGAIVNAYHDGMPRPTPPDKDALANATISGGSKPGSEVLTHLNNFHQWINYIPYGNDSVCTDQAVASAGNKADPPQQVQALSSLDQQVTKLFVYKSEAGQNMRNLVTMLTKHPSSGSVEDQIFSVIDAQAADSGIWNRISGCVKNDDKSNRYFTLGAQLVTANPLAELSFWGYANLSTAYGLWKNILDYSVLEADQETLSRVLPFSKGMYGSDQYALQKPALMSRYYGFVASIYGMVSIIFLMCGFTLAFVVPLLPFFRFFFNVLTWLVSLLEAVVAVPLIALAHLNPEGEGLPGNSAKAAYFLIFNIFLRPAMTMFGLIAGLLVFYVAIMLLNMTYVVAVAGTIFASYNFGLGTVVRIAFTVMYGATAYVCANTAFKTIGVFPQHALEWIGSRAHHEGMGDGGKAVMAVMGQTQGYMGEKAVGVIKLKPN